MHRTHRILAALCILAAARLASANDEPATKQIEKEYYPSGVVKSQTITTLNGTKTIRWFDEDGRLRSGVRLRGAYEETFVDGSLTRVRKFRESGCLEFDAIVKAGVFHKVCEYDKHGRPRNGMHTEEYGNGNYKEWQYLDGKKHGVSRVHEEQRGLVLEQTWVLGKMTSVRAFYKDGTTNYTRDVKDGKMQIRRDYHADGTLDCERFWREGVEVFRRYRRDEGFGEHYGDAYTTYYKGGTVKTSGRLSDGKKVGKWTTLREDGSIARCVTFADDKPIIVKRYDEQGDLTYDGEPDEAVLREWRED